ncbi:TIGR03790 family protein [Methylomonas paludis]|uniref:TIGR03790 family protein n=1 Tax=Methylomonas paludis TaxID=1173101 RepID=UPI001FE62D6E|nr:TIGR03790 family protein [Methylomonas paludis]
MSLTLKITSSIFGLLLSLSIASAQTLAISPLFKPASALSAEELAIIVNDEDKLSQQIGAYYQEKRHIPIEQVIHIRFSPYQAILSKHEFDKLKQQVDAQLPERVQALVLTWLQPFRVECMSITTAFAVGFDPAFCADGCKQTRRDPYYLSETDKPFKTHGWRPTIALAGKDFSEAQKIIDTGIAADYTHPQGSAYLLKTSDVARSSRAEFFALIAEKFSNFWPVHYLEQDYIAGRNDVMFYFTGLTHVPHLNENHYLPGAVADHLTSSGGVMSGNDQMNIMEWLRAGATGSYGAVIEPCNFPAKFPDPGVLMYFYLRGSTLIEAYWKSVAEPGQGIFVGEPLAKPFAYRLHNTAN